MLNEVRDARLSKAHIAHVKSMQNFLGMTGDYAKKRAEIERQHSKQLNELYESFKKQSEVVEKEIKLPTLFASWQLVLTELQNEMLGSKTLSTRINDEVSKPLVDYLSKVKMQTKQMWKDRAEEEADLQKQDDDSTNLMKEASENFKRATADPSNSKLPFKQKGLLKSQNDIANSQVRHVVHSKISHNKYLVANVAANAHRRQFWSQESTEMMDTMEKIGYLKFIQNIQSIFGAYVGVLSQYASSLPQNIEDIMSTNKDGYDIGVDYINPETDIQSTVDYLSEIGHVPFVMPESKPFESQNSYGVNLLVDDQTLYSLSYARNVLLQKKEENEEKMRKKEEEVESISKLSDTYADNPDLGNQEDVQENILTWQRELRHCRLEQARNIQMLKIFDCAGINSGHCHTHNFTKLTLMLAQECAFCGEKAGGVHVKAVSCKTCKTVCHEGYCAGSIFKGCKNDNTTAMLENIVSVPYVDDEDGVVLSNRASVSLSRASGINHDANLADDEFGQQEEYDDGLERIVVMYDYIAQNEYEVSACENDVAIIVEKSKQDWYKCTINGETGMFPTSYLEGPGENAVFDDEDKEDDDFEEGDGLAGAEGEGIDGPRVRALYDYVGQNSDELSFYKDEILIAKGEDDDGWTEGMTLDGKAGVFPTNYVEPLESDFE